MILSPENGAVVRGTIDVDLRVVEISCSITARTCVTIRDSAGAEALFFCTDIGISRLDTTRFRNGLYTIFAQPACNRSPICPNGQTITVEIRN